MRLYTRHAGQPWFVASSPQEAPEGAEEDDALDEALRETFPASDPVEPRHID